MSSPAEPRHQPRVTHIFVSKEVTRVAGERVTLQVNSVDRIFLAGYLPKLQSEGQVVRFLLDRGVPIPSPAVLGKIGEAYVRAIERLRASTGSRWCISRRASRRSLSHAGTCARLSGRVASGW